MFILESTERQRRERENESKLRTAPEPTRPQGERELGAAAAAGGERGGAPEKPGGVSPGPRACPSWFFG